MNPTENNQANQPKIEPSSKFVTEQKSPLIMPRGKTIPQAEDIERAILGAMMIDKTALDESLTLLSQEAFFNPKHQIIFKGMAKLWQDQNPVHLHSLSLTLKAGKQIDTIGGDVYLAKLATHFASSAHVVYHATILLQMQMRRELIQLAGKINTDVYDQELEIFALLEKIEQKLYEIGDGANRKDVNSMEDLLKRCLEQIEEAQARSGETGMIGLSTGFSEVDNITSGLQDSDLIIIAARPSMGKTAFALSMLRNISIINKVPAAFFSLEMSSSQVMHRILSMETQISQKKIKSGNLTAMDWEKIRSKTKELKGIPLYIDDTPGLSLFEFRSKTRKLVAKLDIKVIVIDYLQLMQDGSAHKKSGGNREQEIASISRSLKGIAKELSLPVVALAQLSRAVESRPNKRPMMSDLRESGAIEQDADIVSFIYRPEKYPELNDEWEDGTPSKGQAELMISKHRNGETGRVRMKFNGEYAQFQDLAPSENQSYTRAFDSSQISGKNPFKTDTDSGTPF